MPRVKIIGYSDTWSAHEVEGEAYCKFIDILVTGDFPPETKPEDLIGKTVEFDRTYPFIKIAYGCKIVEEDE